MKQRVLEARGKKDEFQKASQRRLLSTEDLDTFLTKRAVSFRQGCEVCLCESEAVAEG